MSDHEPSYCDHIPIEQRAKELRRHYLPEIERETGGRVSISTFSKYEENS